ncbi:hypothetical protein AC1031_004792 [Aphanomyces cochlioides]|nr:hypothetical protein AC1031_004792 [Aphanomyces cochlioides]
MYGVVVPYDEIKLKRQARRTELQRERRGRERIEIKKLKQFAEQLEKKRRQWSRKNTSDQPLSWEDVATSLKEATQDAQDENAKLKEEQRKLVQVISGMTKWIASAKGIMRGPHTLPYTASHLNLHRVTLNAADPICRQHGLDWLTQILYHNTEALLRRYVFWPEISTDVQCSYHTDMSNIDDVQCVWRFQVDIPKAMEGVVDAVRQKVVNRLNNTNMWDLSSSLIDPELVSRISPTMTYVRRHPQSSTQNGSNILYQEFQDGTDRTVFVGQNIYDDKFESPAKRSKSMTLLTFAPFLYQYDFYLGFKSPASLHHGPESRS